MTTDVSLFTHLPVLLSVTLPVKAEWTEESGKVEITRNGRKCHSADTCQTRIP